ncbi:MAG: tryptophan 7-halogenase [Acidimicrobiales bacterium]
MARDAEVIVVGGGVAGCAAAIALARAGVEVAVVGPTAAPAWRVGETVPPRIRPLLEGLGTWDDFVADGHLPVAGTVSAWGDGEAAERDFLFDPYGPGWHLDRGRFDAMLAAAATRAGARQVSGRPVRLARLPEGGWRLAVDGAHPSELAAPFVVDATGRSSWAGRACGARRRVVDRLVGVVAVVRPGPSGADAGDPRTFVEAVEDGWWYTAVVPGGAVVAAWMTDADLLPARPVYPAQAWAAGLAHAPRTAPRLGGAAPDVVAAVRVVAAGSSALFPPAGDGWMAVGDAAATMDPLSSSGIATALASGRAAATALTATLAGDAGAIPAYAATAVTGYARYLASRTGYYALEQRWPAAPFWRRRHSRLAPATAVPDDLVQEERHAPPEDRLLRHLPRHRDRPPGQQPRRLLRRA